MCRSKQKTEQKPPLKPTPKSKSEAKARNVAAVDAEWDQDHGEYYLNAINAIGGDTPRIAVTPKINGKSITMEVDTGAAVSIIPRKTWMDNFKKFPLKAANVVLTTYSHDKLAVLGQRLMSVELDGQTATLPIIVVGGDGPVPANPHRFRRTVSRSDVPHCH